MVFALAACNPACTAPAADSPDAANPRSGDDSAAESGAPAASGNDGGSQGPGPADGEMITTAKGVDLSGLDENKKTSFFQIINSESSACGKPESLAKSVRDDASCRDSLSVSQFIADALKAGHAPADIKDAMEMVLDSLRVREIPLESSPIYGNERAPVTIIVFADFECPHCRAEAPKLRQTVDQFRGRARLIFKHFPLSSHPRAKQAAIATEAAKQQGKFWEMHDIVFENQTALEDEDIVRYAQDIGLDMGKFRAAYESKLGRDQVESDRALGEKLEITGTPAVFINGRYFNDLLFGGTFAGWVDDALRR
ncbi:MAG: thioredoxin domain-containing protein [Myxococcales bacterium]|nr:thioredoxin domain-containing protein [Myxococcales bacterium]MCB9749346.1 thioredoxin domain-containing protein [Myxococcales bacterium]